MSWGRIGRAGWGINSVRCTNGLEGGNRALYLPDRIAVLDERLETLSVAGIPDTATELVKRDCGTKKGRHT